MEAIVLILFFAIWWISNIVLEQKVDNYPVGKVDTTKMLTDKYTNNLSDKQVQRNMVNGKYDKR